MLNRRRNWILIIVVVVVVVAVGAGWAYHERPESCAMCHIMQTYLDGWEKPSDLAYEHRRANVECLDCHPFDPVQSAKEVIAFVTNDYENPLAERQFSAEWCFRCHPAHSSYEQIIELTKDYKTDSCEAMNPHAYEMDNTSLIVSNPHEIPEGVNGKVECYHCHKMHRESPGLALCIECHHTASLDKASFEPCGNCHEGGVGGSSSGGSMQMF